MVIRRMMLLAGMMLIGGCAMSGRTAVTMSDQGTQWKTRAETLPRKVLVASVMQRFRGPVEERVKLAEDLIAEAGQKAAGKKLDLVILPEYAIADAQGNAVKLEGMVQDRLSAAVKKIGAYAIVCMVRDEGETKSNAAILFDRQGKVIGTYRKVHAVVENGKLECGIKPGAQWPVFDCDFGKLGIQICWDMAYNDGWDALAAKGAEIVASPSASPATIRVGAHAVRNNYWVITSTVRDNVTLFNPLGMIASQSTQGRVMLCELDLSYALLGWSEQLRNGDAMKEKFGDKVGYVFSVREDGGVFWSNDPKKSIGEMYREIGVGEIIPEIHESKRIDDQVRGGPAK